MSGGIAAYKACGLVSEAIKQGFTVRVVMSAHATRFIGQATFEGLTGQAVMTDTFHGEDGMAHIDWPKWADVVCVAPATANLLGKLACGLADDALSTVLMAVRRGTPIVLAPAMNTEMWFHPVVQRNLGWLRQMPRYRIVEPVDKRLACGDLGVGGLAEAADILEAVVAACGESG